MQLAEDLSFATQKRHWLIHIEKRLESHLHLGDIRHGQLLETLLRLSLIEEILLEEKTRQ